MLQGVFLWLSKLERLKMFSLFKKKEKINVVAPISGKLIELEKVKDPVFAKKMMSDGFVIVPNVQSSLLMFMHQLMQKSCHCLLPNMP